MTSPDWHQDTIDSLSRMLAGDQSVKALVLAGSLASPDATADRWSDVDVHVVVEDAALDRYYPDPGWLQPLGDIISCQAVDNAPIGTLRVCLAPFRRLDLSFVPEGPLYGAEPMPFPPFPVHHEVLWSRMHTPPPAVPAP